MGIVHSIDTKFYIELRKQIKQAEVDSIYSFDADIRFFLSLV